jgi:methionyl aminopeptidase
VLEAVTKLCAPGEKIVSICEKGDKLLEEEIGKVYRGKKIVKGDYFPASCQPSKNILPQQKVIH